MRAPSKPRKYSEAKSAANDNSPILKKPEVGSGNKTQQREDLENARSLAAVSSEQ